MKASRANLLFEGSFVCERSEQGQRSSMEDEYVFSETRGWAVCAVLDGHAGKKMARFVKGKLKGLPEYLASNPGKAEDRIRDFLRSIEDSGYKEYKSGKMDGSGCTCTGLCYAFEEGPKKSRRISGGLLYLFNVGDSRTTLVEVKGGTARAFFATEEHNVDDPKEYARLTEMARSRNLKLLTSTKDSEKIVTIRDRTRDDPARFLKPTVARLFGLMMSRSFGDYPIKYYGDKRFEGMLVAEPDVYRVSLSGKGLVYAIVACDGIYDVVSDAKLAEVLAKEDRAGKEARSCRTIVDLADKLGSSDNMSVAVIKFQK